MEIDCFIRQFGSNLSVYGSASYAMLIMVADDDNDVVVVTQYLCTTNKFVVVVVLDNSFGNKNRSSEGSSSEILQSRMLGYRIGGSDTLTTR